MGPSAIRRQPWPGPWLWGRSPLAAPQPFGRRQRGYAGAFAPGPPREARGARTAPAAGKAGIRHCPPSTRNTAAWGVVALLPVSMVDPRGPRTYRLCQLFKVARQTPHLTQPPASHLLGSTWVRTHSTISVVVAPGVNTV